MPPAAKTLFENLLAVLLHGGRMRSVQIRLRRSLRRVLESQKLSDNFAIVRFHSPFDGGKVPFTVGPCPLGF